MSGPRALGGRSRRWSRTRTFLLATAGLALTVVAACLYIPFSLLKLAGRPERVLERVWAGAMLLLAGASVRVTGHERLQPGRSYVIMANHRSWFDIPALQWALGDRDTRFIAKKELVPVPFFGWALAASRHIVIDRQDREKAVRAIRRGAEAGGGQMSIIVFPEGTRSPSTELLPLKKGGFHLAVDSGLEILPVAISGTELILPKRAFGVRPGSIEISIAEPIPTVDTTKAELPRLVQQVRQAIEQGLARGGVD